MNAKVAIRQYPDRTIITVGANGEPIEPGHVYEYDTADVIVHVDPNPLHPGPTKTA